jgi:ADP-ribosylglycohydrolase
MNHVEDPAMLADRTRGCLLGGAIGDALGEPVEFMALNDIRQLYGPRGLDRLECQGPGGTALITDDTQLTLFTAEALIRFATADHPAVEPLVLQAYQRWLDTQHNCAPPPAGSAAHRDGWLREATWLYHRRAPGNACLSGLRSEWPSGGFAAWGQPGPVNPESKGCGTVMRSAPFGLLATDAITAFEDAARCAQFTHGHPTGYLAAGAVAAIVHQLSRGLGLPEAVHRTREQLAGYPGHEETDAALRAAVALAAGSEPSAEHVETLGGGWVAEEALAIAVYCALVSVPAVRPAARDAAADRRAVTEALLLAVNHSGDSDSTGAICGNLLGSWLGWRALPPEWLVCVEHRADIATLADDVVLAATAPRPLAGPWPVSYPAPSGSAAPA